jgi:hypothetical protein
MGNLKYKKYMQAHLTYAATAEMGFALVEGTPIKGRIRREHREN